MKTLFKTVLLAAVGAVLFTSCNNSDDYDYEAEYLKQEKAIDSLLSAQKLKIEDYVDAHFGSAVQEDSIKINFSYLGKTTKRGIWYEVLSEPTDNTYEYKVNSSSTNYNPVYPTWKLKYKATLLDGTVVQEDAAGSEYSFSTNNSKVFNNAWFFSFIPYSIKYSGQDYVYQGLTKNGLKKGSKIRVITPSIFAFGSTANDKIPANSPLVYEFEVLEIK